jgi:signal transduction histidine kinase
MHDPDKTREQLIHEVIALRQRNAELESLEVNTHQEGAEVKRLRLEACLRQSQKMEAFGTLAGGIAHDFNNILTAIIGYTQLAINDIPPYELAWQRLQDVLTASHRAKHLVQQILTFNRQHDHERKPVQLYKLAQEVLTMLRASLPSNIVLQPHFTNPGIVLADPTQMHQVLMNLCLNAEDAMRESGGLLQVCIDAVELDETFGTHHTGLFPGPYIQVKVQDTGDGIADEALERIFEPLFTTKDVGKGTGMGLAVVHGIVTAHGGAITVQSTPGEGSIFEVYLPRIAQPAIDPPSSEESSRFQQTPVVLSRNVFTPIVTHHTPTS